MAPRCPPPSLVAIQVEIRLRKANNTRWLKLEADAGAEPLPAGFMTAPGAGAGVVLCLTDGLPD